ncbi:MAG: GHKL domain-containing protein [Oscillospiraceae bacterium]|nr:GHKL domain-containing protein [Oscillospiraceae bacterium]
MLYVVDNFLNYLIYLFIIYFGFKIQPRKNKIFCWLSVVVVFAAGIFNMYFETNSPIVYVCWSVLSVCLFFKERLLRLGILSFALMYFTGIMDTFSVMLIQILLIGGAVETGLTWWMEIAYAISFSVYFMVYTILLKKNEVYLKDIEYRYKVAILVQGSIFQMFYNFVFAFFDENHEMYGWDAYVVFFVSIVGAIYAIFLTLSLAIKNVLSNRQNKELQSFMYMQKEQYDYQLQQSVAVRRFKHDLTNYIGVLRELVNQKKLEEARGYIDTIWNVQDEFELKIHTGDSFLDVIMNYYLYIATKENIKFTVSGKVTTISYIEMVDITTLMGNVLQNAIEASKKTNNPKVRVEFIEHKTEIFISVSNGVVEKVNTNNNFLKTSKKDKMNHGFGFKNIIATVEKYQGEYYMDSFMENGEPIFKISIAIPKELRR